MIKRILSTSIIVIVTVYAAVAQKGLTPLPTEFKSLIGCWQGTLNYSGTIIRKPYTTTAGLVVKQIGNCNKLEFLLIYTKDPGENVADTISISTNGRKINQQTIKSKRVTTEGNVEIITEVAGFDHDNNMAALIRQTYTIGKQLYTFKKQVQLQGQTDWLDRQEFTYERTPCGNEK